jgi:pilus assembly protein Flp/PilA
MKQLFFRFLTDESGAAAMEYALIGALIAVAVVVGAAALGVTLNARFSTFASTVSNP